MRRNKLKIAVIIKSFVLTGGAEKYAVEVARRLVARGHTIDLFAWRADEEQLDGIRYFPVPLPTRLCFTSVLTSVSFAREAARLLNGRSYDVILSHERGYCQDLATIHTFSYKLGTENHSFIKKLNDLYLSPRSQMHLWLERKQMESQWLVPVSATIKAGIERYYGRTENTAIATPGVDIDWFNPDWVARNRDTVRKSENIGAAELAVLFVGSEFKRKRLDTLIRAIGPGMKLLVIGGGEQGSRFHRLVEKCGVSDQVIFKGLKADVRQYYAAADVAVLPSLKEAFGMSILEAMACGLSVICRSTTGVADLIIHGENGYLFDDPAMIAELLGRLKSAPLRQALGSRARKTAENHTWEKTTDIYEKLCLETADQKAGD